MFKFLRLASKIINDTPSINHSGNYYRTYYNYDSSKEPFKLLDVIIKKNDGTSSEVTMYYYLKDKDIVIRIGNKSSVEVIFDLNTIENYDDTELLYLIRNLSDEVLFKDKEDILEFILENENVWSCKMFPQSKSIRFWGI